MGLIEADAIYREWAKHPPAHWLMAIQIGWKPPEDAAAPKVQTAADWGNWFSGKD